MGAADGIGVGVGGVDRGIGDGIGGIDGGCSPAAEKAPMACVVWFVYVCGLCMCVCE